MGAEVVVLTMSVAVLVALMAADGCGYNCPKSDAVCDGLRVC